jgi:hypothetical protein
MRKELASADYVNEFIDLLETYAPTTRKGSPPRIVPVARA